MKKNSGSYPISVFLRQCFRAAAPAIMLALIWIVGSDPAQASSRPQEH